MAHQSIPGGFELQETSPSEFINYIGPFWRKKTDSNYSFGIVVENRHMNAMGGAHGGFIAALAEISVTGAAYHLSREQSGVTTISMNMEFIAAPGLGQWVEARSSVSQETGSLIFIQTEAYAGENLVFTASAVLKKLRKPA